MFSLGISQTRSQHRDLQQQTSTLTRSQRLILFLFANAPTVFFSFGVVFLSGRFYSPEDGYEFRYPQTWVGDSVSGCFCFDVHSLERGGTVVSARSLQRRCISRQPRPFGSAEVRGKEKISGGALSFSLICTSGGVCVLRNAFAPSPVNVSAGFRHNGSHRAAEPTHEKYVEAQGALP